MLHSSFWWMTIHLPSARSPHIEEGQTATFACISFLHFESKMRVILVVYHEEQSCTDSEDTAYCMYYWALPCMLIL
jgi:hypothetical protein